MRQVDTFFPFGVADLHAQVRYALVAERNRHAYDSEQWRKWNRAVQKQDGLAKYARNIASNNQVTLFNNESDKA